MNGITAWMEKYLVPVAAKIGSQKHLVALRDSFIGMLPATLAGALAETEYGKEIKEKYGLTEMEVTDEVFRSKYARQFEEAENRMHSIKAIMAATLGNLFIPAVPEDFK